LCGNIVISMNLEQSKDKFKKDGYCTFPIKLLNEDYYNFLSECFRGKDLRSLFNSGRLDVETDDGPYSTKFNSVEEKEYLYETTYKGDFITQLWFWNNNWETDIAEFTGVPEIKSIIEDGYKEIIDFLYDFDEDVKIIPNDMQITHYNKHCRITEHSDGDYDDSKHFCSIPLYLNEGWDKNDGGLLYLNGEEIIPEFGTVVAFDLLNHDIKHEVSEVISDVSRNTIIYFPKLQHS